MLIMKYTRAISEYTKKGLRATLAHRWLLHGSMGLHITTLFHVVVAEYPHLFVSLNLVDK